MKQYQLVLFSIFSIAILFRFWKLPERTLFSGEATAELVVLRDMSTGKQSPLLGYAVAPYVKGLYTTPWFWYLLVPLWKLTSGNPEAFMILHPLIGVSGIYFLYQAGVLFHSKKTGLFAAAIYAASMAMVNIDRSVWSHSVVPAGVNLGLYVFARGWKHPTKKTFLLLGIIMGFLASLHFVTLCFSAIILVVILWNKRQFFHWSFLPLLFSSVPLALFDISHQFSVSSAFASALQGAVDGTRSYSIDYFFYQFYPPVILGSALLLSKLQWNINIAFLALFFLWQLRAFSTYTVSPNYAERKELMSQLLEFWEQDKSVTVYLNDKPFFEYGYLFLYLGRNERVTEDSITVLTPSPEDKERAFQLIRKKSLDLDVIPFQDVNILLQTNKAVLVLDEDKLKFLPYTSLEL